MHIHKYTVPNHIHVTTGAVIRRRMAKANQSNQSVDAMREDASRLDPETLDLMVGSCVCLHARQAARAVTQAVNRALEPSGLLATQLVTLVAVERLGGASVSRLADETGMDVSTMARNLKPLEARGLVQRGRRAGAGRRLITLTEAGRDNIARAIPLWHDVQNALLDRVGSERWDIARSVLEDAIASTRSLGGHETR